jgi:hypothetical protein
MNEIERIKVNKENEINIVLNSLNDVVKLINKQQKQSINNYSYTNEKNLHWNIKVLIQCANELIDLN